MTAAGRHHYHHHQQSSAVFVPPFMLKSGEINHRSLSWSLINLQSSAPTVAMAAATAATVHTVWPFVKDLTRCSSLNNFFPSFDLSQHHTDHHWPKNTRPQHTLFVCPQHTSATGACSTSSTTSAVHLDFQVSFYRFNND